MQLRVVGMNDAKHRADFGKKRLELEALTQLQSYRII